jgi:indole-3-glycerol phosphate synthase
LTVLDDIIVGVRADLAARRADLGLAEVRARALTRGPARILRPGPGLICEVKRASPSAGALAVIDDPAALAAAYARGGAAAISVLTERRRFHGSLADLDAVRAAVDVPILRKDFVVDEYQVYETRAHDADLLLLIVAALSDDQLSHLYGLGRELGLTVLVETHTPEEIDRASALDLEGALLGVNVRNLKDLSVDTGRFAPLAALAPTGPVLVAESGVRTAADVAAYATAGAGLVLVGEALVKAGEPAEAVTSFTAAARASHG